MLAYDFKFRPGTELRSQKKSQSKKEKKITAEGFRRDSLLNPWNDPGRASMAEVGCGSLTRRALAARAFLITRTPPPNVQTSL